MLDILIKNGTVVDGTGKRAFKADVGIAQNCIALVAETIDQEAARIIDAKGLHLAPGFIDVHSHSDLTLLVNPHAESKVRQGVTTEVIGNCGFSAAPLQGQAVEEIGKMAEHINLDVTWASTEEYLNRLKTPGTAVNVVPLVGHNTVRGSVLGYGEAQPGSIKQADMEHLVAESLAQGTRGLSTGLYYPPGQFARTEEVVGLAKVAAQQGGIYASHIRSESDRLLDAVEEAIRMGQEADIRVEISHLKVSGYRNWDRVDELIGLIESAEEKGVILGCDQYPYPAGSTWLAALLPYWVQAGGYKEIVKRLGDPQIRAQIKQDRIEHRSEWENRVGIRDWSDVIISDCQAKPEVEGSALVDVAKAEDRDPLDVVFDLIVASEGQVDCVWFTQSEEVVRKLLRHPLVIVGSDGSALSPDGILGRNKPHPRNYGTFPRVLGRYVREEKLLTLEEAIQKMSSIPATRFGLEDRGVIRESAWADLVLFEADTVIDTATYTDPHQYPVGIPYVIVNGEIVIDQGEQTGALPGRVL